MGYSTYRTDDGGKVVGKTTYRTDGKVDNYDLNSDGTYEKNTYSSGKAYADSNLNAFAGEPSKGDVYSRPASPDKIWKDRDGVL